ncbi:MAG: hypothetical protein MUC65_00160 [Pontiellaceae bacterium]|jgi:hypothetical protein|nr:hypothetical protein [Pontiellaceae bacterium]
MNPPPDEIKPAPNRLGKIFFVLVLPACVAGLAFGALVVWGPADGPCKKIFLQASSSFKKFIRSNALLNKIGPETTITCRGVTLDTGNNPLAILDDQTVGIGQIFNGVKVIDITSSYVLIEHQGETRRLALGEKFTFSTNN